jgi:hypothetical protein
MAGNWPIDQFLVVGFFNILKQTSLPFITLLSAQSLFPPACDNPEQEMNSDEADDNTVKNLWPLQFASFWNQVYEHSANDQRQVFP